MLCRNISDSVSEAQLHRLLGKTWVSPTPYNLLTSNRLHQSISPFHSPIGFPIPYNFPPADWFTPRHLILPFLPALWHSPIRWSVSPNIHFVTCRSASPTAYNPSNTWSASIALYHPPIPPTGFPNPIVLFHPPMGQHIPYNKLSHQPICFPNTMPPTLRPPNQLREPPCASITFILLSAFPTPFYPLTSLKSSPTPSTLPPTQQTSRSWIHIQLWFFKPTTLLFYFIVIDHDI